MDLASKDARLLALLNERAKAFADDNFHHPTVSDYLIVHTAMTIGASIAHEVETQALREEITTLKAT